MMTFTIAHQHHSIIPRSTRAISLALFSSLAILAILFCLYDDEGTTVTTNIRRQKARRRQHRNLLGLNIAYQDPKTIASRQFDDGDDNDNDNNNIMTADTNNIDAEAMQVPCRPKRHDEANIVSIGPEFYITNKHCYTDLSNDIIFFHVGKGGGGTVELKLRQAQIAYASSHPIPAVKQKEELLSTEEGTASSLVVNVRDPVDRFVSAFKWDLMRTCSSPDSDERGIIGDQWRGDSTYLYKSSCETSAIREEMLRVKYMSDPNLLAAALCDVEDKSSPEYIQAAEDYMLIEHDLKLTQWLDFLLTEQDSSSSAAAAAAGGIDKLVVLPMEHHFDELIDGYILHLLQETYGSDAGIYMHETYIDQIQKSHFNVQGTKHSTSRVDIRPLTTYGECCIARHLEDDYILMQAMTVGTEEGETNSQQTAIHPIIYKACTSWGSLEQQQLCLKDLSSMLARRAVYLDRSQGTCSELFGR